MLGKSLRFFMYNVILEPKREKRGHILRKLEPEVGGAHSRK